MYKITPITNPIAQNKCKINGRFKCLANCYLHR